MDKQPMPEVLTAATLSRRRLLAGAGALGGSLAFGGILAACGGDDGDESAGAVDASGRVGGRFDIYTFEGYDLPDVSKAWRRKHDVNVKAAYVGAPDDVPTRIKSPAGKGIDASTIVAFYLAYVKELGIVSAIRAEDVPSLEKLYPFFKEGRWRNEDGTYNSVPWTWGVLGLNYVPGKIDEPDSYDVLFEPDLKGRVSVLDDAQSNFQLASIVLGHDPDKLTQSQFDETKAWLKRLAGQARTISATIGDQISLLASGDADIAFTGWAASDIFIQAAGGKSKFVTPGDVGMPYVDSIFIPTTADNPKTALAWCELCISGKTAAAAAESLGGGVPNPEVVPLLSKATRGLYPYDDVDGYLNGLQLPAGFPRDGEEFATLEDVTKAWEEIKAG